MKKQYVFDTNVLIHDPEAIFKFDDNDLFIPIFVIEEIDQFKREGTERGRNCRHFSRTLDDLRSKSDKSLAEGISLGDGKGILTIVLPKGHDQKKSTDHGAQDRAILDCAMEIRSRDDKTPTIFITMDTNLRIRADAFGMPSETYENSRMKIESGSSVNTIDVHGDEIDEFFANGYSTTGITPDLRANASVFMRDELSDSHTAIGRYHSKKGEIRQLKIPKDGIRGIRPKSMEQAFALDLLLDDEVRLVTLVGKAGCGKTLLAIAAGLKKVLEDAKYTRMLVSRPIMPLGKDLGFLPGTIEEKLNPWMQPIFDNLEFLFGNKDAKKSTDSSYSDLIASGQIQVEPLTYIRGRSLPFQYIIVDEAQNLTPHEIKTIITRAGEGSKIVLTGDPDQIDNPYIDSASNGLSVVAERFRMENIAGHVVLTKGERSELADLATRLL